MKKELIEACLMKLKTLAEHVANNPEALGAVLSLESALAHEVPELPVERVEVVVEKVEEAPHGRVKKQKELILDEGESEQHQAESLHFVPKAKGK
jgi:hypothetical protein